MTSELTRRTALGAFTVAGITAISGCSSSVFSSTSVKTHAPSPSNSSEPAATSSSASPSASSSSAIADSPSPSPSSSTADYSVEVKIDKYDTSPGSFEAATKEHPARNVPKPIKPEKLGEESVEGFKAALGYLSAALNYYFLTGRTEFLREVRLTESIVSKSESAGAPIREQRSWYGSPEMKLFLNTSEPTKTGNRYMWPFTAKLDQGSFIVNNGVYSSLSSSRRYSESHQMAVGTYEDGHWTITWYSRGSSNSSPSSANNLSSSNGNVI